MLIRPFCCMKDIRACADIAISCWNHNTADRVVEQITDGYYLVAEIDGHVVGFVGARKSFVAPNAWEIPWIAVSPDHHGMNIGSMLLNHILVELINQRRAALILTMTQRTKFFGNGGFKIVETYNDDWSLMTVSLKPIHI